MKQTKRTTILLFLLREMRLRANLQQSKIATGIGMQMSGYCKIEKGGVKLTLANLFKILSFYNKSPAVFMAEAEALEKELISKGWAIAAEGSFLEEDSLLKHMEESNNTVFIPKKPDLARPL